MATQVETLTEAHRAAETRRAAIVAAAVAAYWRARVRENDPAVIERWVAAVVPLILREQLRSAAQGALFANTMRAIETGVNDGFIFEPQVPADAEGRIRTSLIVTGPVALQKRLEKISGADISPAEARALTDAALDLTGAGAAGSAARHVQSGGRESIRAGTTKDPVALGYVRITRADPCFFCALLASRGAVYKSDSFEESDSGFDGPGNFKAHDSCGCSLKPLYRRDDPLLDRSKAFSELYATSTAGKSGPAALLAFRRAYEGR